MPTGNTSLLGLALPVEGELDGTWGDVVNDSITSLVDSAVAGTTTLTTDADVTLTTTVLAANQARQAIIRWAPASGTVTRNITAPAQSKPYIVINATGGTQSIVLRGAGPTTGITIVAGERCLAAWSGSDFVKVASSVDTGITANTPNTFTATQTFSGSASVLAMILNDAAEVATVSATAATGTINYDVTTQSVLFYTTNASGNWTLNVRASSGTTLNTALATGQSVTIAFLVTQGTTAYYQSAFQVDGTSVTPKWQGGTAPTAGNASGVDIYVVTIIKTGAATFSAFASQTRFA